MPTLATAATYRRLGGALLVAGKPAEAAEAFRHSLEHEPDNVRGHNNLGQALMALGRTSEALRHFERTLQLMPDYAIGHNNVGIACSELGQLSQAIASYRRAIALNPGFAQAHYNCGNALRRMGDPGGALACYDEVTKLAPQQAETRVSRGDVLQELQRYEAALSDYDYVLEREPGHAIAWINKANALLELKQADEALACCDRAIQLRPDIAAAHTNRAGALKALQRLTEALAASAVALQIDPANLEGWYKRGGILYDMCAVDAARECYVRALELDPDSMKARLRLLSSHLPIIPQSADEIAPSRSAVSEELTRFTHWAESAGVSCSDAGVGLGQLFYLTYQPHCNKDLLARYRGLCARLLSSTYASTAATVRTAPVGRTRIGIVSAHVYEHSVYRALLKGWLSHLDRDRFEIQLFNLGTRQDAHTFAARTMVDRFEAGGRAAGEWVETIRASHLDALIFPEVGMDDLTLTLAALRLARHQFAAWGHPETTGLPTIDYYLSAEAFEPSDAEQHYTEQLVRLPNLGSYYEPYGVAPSLVDMEALGVVPGVPVFVCPGVPFKYGPQYDTVFTEIARRVGRCQFVFFEFKNASMSRRLQERLCGAFHRDGLEASRYVAFVPWQTQEAFFGVLRSADIYLDTIGFSGFNTLMQAVECGLPCVVHEGAYLRGRLGSGILRQMNLSELVATDTAQYVEKATQLAQDAGYRDSIRRKMRAGSAAVMRDPAPAEALARLLAQLA